MKGETKVVVSKEKELMQNLRKHCENVEKEKEKREEEKRKEVERQKEEKQKQVKYIVEKWLYKKFGYGKKPWRAVEGRKKKLRPIPFYEYECDIKWTDISKDLMIEILQDLGFIRYTSLNGSGITLTVSEHKKGEKLTWAQEKIRKLNHDYSLYMSDQKRFAQFLFKEMLVELANYDIEKTEVGEGYTLFKDYKFGETMGQKPRVFYGRQSWYKFIKRLFRENGIEECFVDEKYIGIRVFNTK